MWKQLKKDYRVLKHGHSGNRFRNFQRYKQEHQDSAMHRVTVCLIAVMLIVVGLAIGWLPGPGGFIAIVGVALLAPYVPGVPSLLDRIELTLSRIYHRLFAKQ